MTYRIRKAKGLFDIRYNDQQRWFAVVFRNDEVVRWFAFSRESYADAAIKSLSAASAPDFASSPAGTVGHGKTERALMRDYQDVVFIDEEKEKSVDNKNLRRGTARYRDGRLRWFIMEGITGRWHAFETRELADKAFSDFPRNATAFAINRGGSGVSGMKNSGYTIASWDTPENSMTTDELWALIGKAANEHNLCPQYDAFAKEHGGPPRPPKTRRMRISIAFPIDFDVPEGKNPMEHWNSMQPSDQRAAVQDRLDFVTSNNRKIVPGDFFFDRAVER